MMRTLSSSTEKQTEHQYTTTCSIPVSLKIGPWELNNAKLPTAIATHVLVIRKPFL